MHTEQCASRNGVILAVVAVAFGIGIITQALVGLYYDGRITALKAAHADEMRRVIRKHDTIEARLRKRIDEDMRGLHSVCKREDFAK